MRKRLLSTLLALCVVLALLPGTVQAAIGEVQSGEYGDLTWKYEPKLNEYGWETAGGTLTIGGKGDMPDSNIPCSNTAPWSDYLSDVSKVTIEPGVTSIGSYAFRFFYNLTDLSIPDSVTAIGEGAFSLCKKLTDISIPDSVTSIGASAFSDCSNLTDIIIPNSVTIIGMSVFASCSSLSSITIPGSVNVISSLLFSGCSNLSEVTLQNGVKYIENGAYSGCSKLTHISIPASVIRVGNHFAYEAFSGCSNLTEITVSPQNTEYSSRDGVLYTKEKDTLLFCPPSRTTFIIPDGISAIGAAAFNDCIKLTAVTIPTSVNDIGVFAFEDCTSLTNITVPEDVTSLYGVFSGCSNLETIHLPVSLTYIDSGTFYKCPLKSIVYSGTETQWGQIRIQSGNAEIDGADITFLNQSTPDTPSKPEKPDSPTTPDTPTTPGTLSLTAANGGLGKKVTVKIEAGHWLTIQTRRSGSISITSVQAPGSNGMVELSFSASTGSSIQVWETAEEMTFVNGIPATPILATASRTL